MNKLYMGVTPQKCQYKAWVTVPCILCDIGVRNKIYFQLKTAGNKVMKNHHIQVVSFHSTIYNYI